MKRKILAIIALVTVSIGMASGQSNKINTKSFNDSIAYVIGANIGANLKKNMDADSLHFNQRLLIQGFKDALDGMDSLVFIQKVKDEIMLKFQKTMQEKQLKKMTLESAPNKEAGNKFLAENKHKDGVIETASGLQYKVLKAGNGKSPSISDKVTVNYEGKLLDGTIFDSSYDRKAPETFGVSQVIKGWTEALQLMKEGGIYELYIKSDLAYGDQGNQSIPGGALLIFKVELIKVEP